MKKVLFVFLSLTLVFTLLAVSACQEEDKNPPHTHSYVNGVCECGDKEAHTHNFVGGRCSTCAWVEPSEGLLLTLSSNGQYYSVTGKGSFTGSTLSIPEVYKSKPVKEIATNAFNGALITSVHIPSSISTIKERAFNDCVLLTEVVLVKGITSIEPYAFYNCESLSTVTIPETVTSLGTGVFAYCSDLESVVIPKSITALSDWLFSNCDSLNSVTINDTVVSIGEYAFYGCKALTKITIPSSVTTMGYGVFYDCDNLSISCKSQAKPNGWNEKWNYSNRPVVWGYNG